MTYLQAQGGGITMVVFCFIFAPLAVVAVCLRIWARRLKGKKLEINDYCAVVATVLAVGNTVLTLMAVFMGGVGRHLDLILPELPTLNKIVLALAIMWTLANTAVKFSVLHLYMVIFQNRKFRYTVYGVMLLTAAYCLTNIILNLLTCHPIAFNWNKTIPGGHCSSDETPFLSSAIINMSIDVIIVALPMPMVWNLQMKTEKKVALSFIFGMGSLICILSAVRISAIYRLNYADFSYGVVPDGIYSVLEPCLGVINSCLPVLQPVGNVIASSRIFSLLRPTTAGTSKPSTNSNSNRGGSANKLAYEQGKRWNRLRDPLESDLTSKSKDDILPLTDIISSKNRAIIRTYTPENGNTQGTRQNGQIEVTRDWNVQSA